jgi:hypothetical protein
MKKFINGALLAPDSCALAESSAAVLGSTVASAAFKKAVGKVSRFAA